MSDAATLTLERAPPRRRDAAATRAAIILEAAQGQFARLGYDRAALRDIAAEAGADVALIKRYFGGKEALFTEALKASIRAEPLKAWSRASFAHEAATMMAGLPDAKARGGPHGHRGEADHDETRAHSFPVPVVRAATSPTTAPLLNLAVQERFLTPIRDWLGGQDAQDDAIKARARVLAGAFIGFLVERLIRNEPLQDRERAVFIERVTALFEALIGEG